MAFLEISLADEDGIANLWEAKNITISVRGPAELLGAGSANPSSEESFKANTIQTYDGRLLVALRSTNEKGDAVIICRAEGLPEQKLKIKCYI